MAYEIKRPIFVVGTGRCGSTILNKVLAEHPNLAFLTTASSAFPSYPSIQRLILNLWDKPILGPLLRLRLIAGEAWPYWNQYIAGFSRTCRDFTEHDITLTQKEKLKKELPKLLTKQRQRLLIKFTGWTRVNFIKEIYPDAKIIHITRDPRAVVNSMLHVYFWAGRQGPYKLNYSYLNSEEIEFWNRHQQSFIAIAALEYKKVMDAFHTSLNKLPKHFQEDVMDISYSALCENHEMLISEVLTFCELDKHPKFMNMIAGYELKNQNHKWKTQLTQQQQLDLNRIVEELNLNQYADA